MFNIKTRLNILSDKLYENLHLTDKLTYNEMKQRLKTLKAELKTFNRKASADEPTDAYIAKESLEEILYLSMRLTKMQEYRDDTVENQQAIMQPLEKKNLQKSIKYINRVIRAMTDLEYDGDNQEKFFKKYKVVVPYKTKRNN